jgi:hypothetical protein
MNHRAHDSPISEDIRSARCALCSAIGVKDTGGKWGKNVYTECFFIFCLDTSGHYHNLCIEHTTVYLLHSIDNVQI